jgi:7-carboxy-7-deazaguanine synthase
VADLRVSRVVDLKTPGSGEEGRNRFENLALLTPRDAVKIVVRDRADYDWAKAVLADKLSSVPCPVFFSPSHAELGASRRQPQRSRGRYLAACPYGRD